MIYVVVVAISIIIGSKYWYRVPPAGGPVDLRSVNLLSRAEFTILTIRSTCTRDFL